MQIERTNSNNLVVNGLPDGSRVIVDSANEKVYALNAMAGAAWEACNAPTTLSKVTESMRQTLNSDVSEDIAEQAILRLQEQNLVKASGSSAGTSRRTVLAALGAVALPLVVSMTLADQRAYAQSARSTTTNFRRPEVHISQESGPKQ